MGDWILVNKSEEEGSFWMKFVACKTKLTDLVLGFSVGAASNSKFEFSPNLLVGTVDLFVMLWNCLMAELD